MNASRQSFIVSTLLCALMAAVFVARWRLAPWPLEAPVEGGMPLAAALVRLTAAHPWWAAALAAVIAVWTLLLVTQMGIKYGPPASRNYLPAQIFLVGAGGVVVAGEALASLAAGWLMALALRQLIFSLHKGYRFRELFHAGFYLGAIPLLYAPAAAWVVPVAVAGLAIYRRSGREAVVCFAGLALPVPAAGFIHWAVGGVDGGFIWRELWRCAVEPRVVAAAANQAGGVPWPGLVVAALVLGLGLTGAVWAAAHKKSIRKTQYKFMQHTSVVMLAVAASAALGGTSTGIAPLVAVPVALCVPYAFQGAQAVSSTIVYCIAAAAAVAIGLLPVLSLFVA